MDGLSDWVGFVSRHGLGLPNSGLIGTPETRSPIPSDRLLLGLLPTELLVKDELNRGGSSFEGSNGLREQRQGEGDLYLPIELGSGLISDLRVKVERTVEGRVGDGSFQRSDELGRYEPSSHSVRGIPVDQIPDYLRFYIDRPDQRFHQIIRELGSVVPFSLVRLLEERG